MTAVGTTSIRLTAGIVALSAAIALSACTAGASASSSSPVPTENASTDTATASPSAPVLAPRLSADENLPYFDLTNTRVVAANAGAGGRDFIDALVAAGFDKAAMQVTPDRTAVDLAADSVQFAVLFNGTCLIGQYGPASGGYHGMVAAPTAQGTCLVGSTRPIDW